MLGLANRTDGIIQGLIPNYFHYLILRAAYGIVRFMTHKHNKKVKGAKEVGIFIVLWCFDVFVKRLNAANFIFLEYCLFLHICNWFQRNPYLNFLSSYRLSL